MTQSTIKTREKLPEDMRILLQDYPRADWHDHPNFARSIGNWLGAHQMFKRLSDGLQAKTERFLSKDQDPGAYASELSFYGNQLIDNLHGHHHWEDHSYFPEIRRFDKRFDQGLETLEADHQELDKTLDILTRSGNRVLPLLQMEEDQARTEVGELLTAVTRIGTFLDRHLDDEEDLIVPILLHHKMRG